MFLRLTLISCVWVCISATSGSSRAQDEPLSVATGPDYATAVAPVFIKYCVSCHNDDDREGSLSLESFASMQEGGDIGPALLAGDSASSQIIRRITGDAEPIMPPDDMEGPNDEELQQLTAWIDAGAAGPDGRELDMTRLIVPRLQPSEQLGAITAMAWSPRGDTLAVARFQRVELIDPSSGERKLELAELPGKVNSLEFSDDGEWLVAASGITGVYGLAVGWDIASGQEMFRLQGHRDSLYAATVDADKSRIATAGYDKKIVIWDVESGESVRDLSGHNQPVYDLAFHPDGEVLTSASADETVKIWNVESGVRLDTLGQPLAEQYVTSISPDGRYVLGGGADNRIRVWELVSFDKPEINPLRIARFAHEQPITQLLFSTDGKRLVSASEDRVIKVWDTASWVETQIFEPQNETISALALAPDGASLFVGMMDGTLKSLEVDRGATQGTTDTVTPMQTFAAESGDMQQVTEIEPNDDVATATSVPRPATVQGVIHSTDGGVPDVDVYRIEAKQGETMILEIVASRDGSPLDSFVEVLDENGDSIERVLLQAVRDSYFTFRGKDSNTSDDFRVHNWEEMELNEYLFANGEVVRLWLYPRGPDSGFQVYPGRGKRHSFFDTTPLSHALQAPCYIVKPHPPGTELIPNGLPVFPIYFENDDESRRKAGTDSKLTFTAPQDGTYLVRVSDTRGFEGESFSYKLQVRPPKPDFKVTVGNANPSVAPGNAKEFVVNVERYDGFDGPIHVEVEGLPPGFHSTSPITIEEGQNQALGLLWSDVDASAPTPENESSSQVTAHAMINGETVSHNVNSLGKIQQAEPKAIEIRLSADGASPSQAIDPDNPLVLEIRPGQTITALATANRKGFQGRISFGNADSGRNLPHGVFVDNIGLNGLMIVEGQTERRFFITAAPFVTPQERMFHLRVTEGEKPCSLPVLIRVVE